MAVTDIRDRTQTAELTARYAVKEYDEASASVQALQLAYADFPEEVHDTIEIAGVEVGDEGYEIDVKAYLEISSQAWTLQVTQLG